MLFRSLLLLLGAYMEFSDRSMDDKNRIIRGSPGSEMCIRDRNRPAVKMFWQNKWQNCGRTDSQQHAGGYQNFVKESLWTLHRPDATMRCV